MWWKNSSERPVSDSRVARLLASLCIFLYLIIFAVLMYIASSNGASLEKMFGLELAPYADTSEYRTLARNMIEHQRFFIIPEVPADHARVPGIPVFFALAMLTFGTLVVIPFIQIGFTAATVALIYLIGVRYFSRRVALAAALIYMIDPIVIYAAWIPISESPFMLLFMAGVYAVGYPAKRKYLPYIVGGILLGLAMYMRPIAYYLTPLVALMAFAHHGLTRDALFKAALFILSAFLVIAPWMMRNYVQTGYFQFSSARAWQFYAYHMATFEAARTGGNYEDIQMQYAKQFGRFDEKILREFEYSEELDAIAREKIMAHPFKFTAFYLFKSAQLFIGSSIVNVKYHMHQFGIRTGEPAHGEGAWGMLVQHRWSDAFWQVVNHIPRTTERLLWVSALLLAVYAVLRSVIERHKNYGWILCAALVLLAYPLMIGTLSDDTRYRMPLEPFLLLLACYGVSLLWPRITGHIRRVVRIA